MVRIFFAFLLAASALIEGAIVEVHNFNQIEDYVTPNTLIVFDIDNTLMQLKQQLGSDEWFYHRMDHYTQAGKSPKAALEKALNEWESIQHLASVDPVESETAALVKSLQDRFYAIGLTTRGLGLATRTIQQLNSINIDLALHPISSDEIHFMVSNEGILYRKGILFTAGRHKGECLRMLLEAADVQPTRVLFINDKRSHILPVESFCESHGIEFIGLRYGFLDEKVQNYNAEIAEVQWQHFGKLISDSEASLLLKQ